MLAPSVFWAVLGLLLIGSEMLIPGFTVFFFGLGALITSLSVLIVPFLPKILQAIIWLASSIGGFVFLRRKFRSVLRGTLIYREDHAGDFAGREAQVLEEITPELPGRIRVNGTSWEAVSFDESYKQGETVLILRQEGMHFIVTSPIDEADIDSKNQYKE